MSIRVVVADDQSMVRAGFRMLLANEPDIEVVAEASNGLEAVHQAVRFRPSVVLMDIRMPELDGLEATRRILAADQAAKILDLDDLRLGRVRLRGAPDRRQRLRTQGRPTRTASRRHPRRCSRRCAAVACHHVTGDRSVRTPTAPRAATRIERADRPRARRVSTARGLSNPEIARELYISETTVKTHITHILQKLNLRDRVQAVVLAYETGLFDDARPPTSRKQPPAR